MRAIVSTLLAMSVLTGTASAAPAKEKRRHYSSHQSTQGDWYPHDASQLPFGSQRWWDQKESEGSAGR